MVSFFLRTRYAGKSSVSPGDSSKEGEIEVGWETGIRTPIKWSRATRPTVRRSPTCKSMPMLRNNDPEFKSGEPPEPARQAGSPESRRAAFYSHRSASEACSPGFVSRTISAMRPSFPTTKVTLSTSLKTRRFVTLTPYRRQSSKSGSGSKSNGRPSVRRKATSASAESGLTPKMTASFCSNSLKSSRNPRASAVQPGVP
jgi:hypothetical protein